MKLMIIRHGDPDYAHDSLTAQGRVEAAALADYLAERRAELTHIYVSPLGRAQATANYTLEKLGRTAETLDWLREFPAKVRFWEDPQLEAAMPCEFESEKKGRIAWDILPEYLMANEDYFHKDHWRRTAVCQHSDMEAVYDRVAAGLDELLARHGYVREGSFYRVEQSNADTLVLFCHFGLECVILSHLLGISPFALWHGFCALPTSITVINTEERRQGIALWRTTHFGDLYHLARRGIPESFHARFCERFEDETLH